MTNQAVFNNTQEYCEKLDSVYAYTYPSVAHEYGRIKIGTTTREEWLRISEQTAGQAEKPTLVGIFNPKTLGLPKKFWKNQILEKALHDYFREKWAKVSQNPSEGDEWFDIGPINLFKADPTLFVYECKDRIRQAIENLSEERIILSKGLQLLPHQDKDFQWLVNNSFFNLSSGFDKVLFWWKCGAGKTFISLKIVERFVNLYKSLAGEMPVILWASAYPVLSRQIANDFREQFVGCETYVSNEWTNDNPIPWLDRSKLNVVFISIQDIDGGHGTLNKGKFVNLPNDWDLLFLDEIHQAVMTPRTQKILQEISYKKLVGLSATPAKNILAGMFEEHQIRRYSLIDEKLYKKKHPEQYKQFPDIKWLIWRLFEEERQNLKQYPAEEQFTFLKFFTLLDGEFVYKDDVIYLIKRLIGIESNGEKLAARYPLKGKGEFNFVQSVLWFLPRVECLEPFQKLLQNIPEIDDRWNVYFTSSDENTSDNLFDKINQEWKPGRGCNRGKNTIILAVEQLTTGVTIPYLDMVILCNDKKSIDWYEQVSYRPQRPDLSRNKTKCFVLDLNPARSILMLGRMYDVEKRNSSITGLTWQEWYENVEVFDRNCKGQFAILPFQEFVNEYNTQLSLLLSSLRMNIFHFHDEKFLSGYKKGYFGWIDFLNLGRQNGKDQEKKAGSIDKGKNSKKTKSNKSGTSNSTKEKLPLELAKSLYERVLLVCAYAGFKKDSLQDSIEYIKSDAEVTKNYLTALLLDESLIEEINLNDIEKFYQENCNIGYIDEQIHNFNQQILCIFELINSSPKESGIMIEKAIDLIGAYLKPSKTEKKNLGEVFTPFELINQMLDKLPQEVWSDPNLKWLDPANGIGNFPAVVVQRLMVGLKDWEANDERRLKHILEKMLYVCDIQPKNMFLYLQIFDNQNQYQMNYYRGSFLDKDFDKHMKTVWGVDKFDIIVGNPPYQDPSKKGRLGGRNPLWTQFVRKSFASLRRDAYLCFVHPSLWRQPNNTKCSILREKNIIYLSINNEKQGLKTFGAETRFDWYIAQNSKCGSLTEILDQENKIWKLDLNTQKWPFIPNMMFDAIEPLIAKNGEGKNEILHSYSLYETRKPWMSKIHTNEYQFPCVYMITKDGVRCFFSSKKEEHFGEVKVIIPPGRISSVTVLADKEGKYGLTEFCWAIKSTQSNVENIAAAMNSKKFKKIAYACSVSKLEYNKNIIGTFKKDFWKDFVEEK